MVKTGTGNGSTPCYSLLSVVLTDPTQGLLSRGSPGHSRQSRFQPVEAALDEAVQATPAPMRAVIAALQALRGVAQVSAATIVFVRIEDFARTEQSPYSLSGETQEANAAYSSVTQPSEAVLTFLI